jgi:hypothetical protein
MCNCNVSNDCKTITLRDVDWSQFNDVTAVTLTVEKGCGCADADTTTFNLYPTLNSKITITSDRTIDIDSYILGQTTQGNTKAISDGVYVFKLAITYTRSDGVSATNTFTVCEFADCTMSCTVQKKVADTTIELEQRMTILNSFKRIHFLTRCNNCCSASDEYNYLSEVLKGTCNDC